MNDMAKVIMNDLCELVKSNSYYDSERQVIVLGEVLELNISKDTIEVYKYADLTDVDFDNYDFDQDYLTTIYMNEREV